MCKAFSGIVEPSCKVTWKLGVDSHESLLALTKLKDDTSDPALMTFARFEITPKNGNYLEPDVWAFKIDQTITPSWFVEKHKTAAFAAHKKWLAKLDKILVRQKIVHPFKIEPPVTITKQHINMLRKWASVRNSVWANVGNSVEDSVWVYYGSFFILPVWKYVKHPRGKYPFTPCVQLWKLGLVPSFDDKIWRLHAHEDARVVFQITAEDLNK